MPVTEITVEFCVRCSLLDPALAVTRELLTHFGSGVLVTLAPCTDGRFALRSGEHALYTNERDDHLLAPQEAVGLVEAFLASAAEPAWTPEALAGMEAIPSFVRERARRQINALAREQGITRITAERFCRLRTAMMQRMGGGRALGGGQLAPELAQLPLEDGARDVLRRYPEFLQKEMLPILQERVAEGTLLRPAAVERVADDTVARMQGRFATFREHVREGTPAPEVTLPNLTGGRRSLAEVRGRWAVLEFGAFT